MRYPGGKFRCYQRLISLIPPHRTYIESHLGGGAVMRHKKPADHNVGIDVDRRVIARFTGFPKGFTFICTSAEEYLSQYHFTGDEFVYTDPPYWPASRRSARAAYRHDYTEENHVQLLTLLRGLRCPVMISGYNNEVYSRMLQGWRHETFWGTSHTGRREQSVWMNYPAGELHDTRFLGADYRERQSIQRKRSRWVQKFLREPVPVRQALLADLRHAHRHA
jgi:DNA adenine methylase